ncbi:hypothetical protein EVAR_70706_1, partial [Eumeta japonica]
MNRVHMRRLAVLIVESVPAARDNRRGPAAAGRCGRHAAAGTAQTRGSGTSRDQSGGPARGRRRGGAAANINAVQRRARGDPSHKW